MLWTLNLTMTMTFDLSASVPSVLSKVKSSTKFFTMELKSISKKTQTNKEHVIVFIPICYSPLTAYQAESSRNGKKKSGATTHSK